MFPQDQRIPMEYFSGRNLRDSTESLDFSADNGPLILNVWASWCGPCRTEMPALQKVFDAKLAAVVGINSKDYSVSSALAFVRTAGITFPSISDPSGQLLLSPPFLGVSLFPSSLVVDSRGAVAARVFGEGTETLFRQILEDVE